MASQPGAPTLAERADIHKSCKSIETLLNTLNEYCEAAGAVVALQKKLGRALKDAASLKVTGEIACNAMNASATVFESLSDVDSKFAKIADKEYDIVSAEVKKWFKKLAKEERAHDERMTNANAKIKQAGQVYEKKSKKKASDASEEHARYINLISTLGPEISQEKYNHAVNVSQRHTATTYSVAACLARLADFEWQRSCECVRRFSPIIGPLGSWRTLCEGGWTGSVPPDLPNLDPELVPPTPQVERSEGLRPIEEDARQTEATTSTASTNVAPEPPESQQQLHVPPPGYSTNPVSPSWSSTDPPRGNQSTHNSPTLTRQALTSSNNPSTVTLSSTAHEAPTTPAAEALEPPRTQFVDNSGSVRSLSAFPSPPTHFPIPPARSPIRQQSSLSQSNLEFPSSTQLAESPVSANDDLPGVGDHEALSSRSGTLKDYIQNSGPPSPEQRFREQPSIPEEVEPNYTRSSATRESYRPMPVRSQTSLPAEAPHQTGRPIETGQRASSSTDIKNLNARMYRDEYREGPPGREFGVLNSPSKSRTIEDYKYSKPIDHMDTGTSASGSIVAAMRNRYSSTSGTTSPPPRDLPRLPLSVNDIAAKYQPTEVPLSPRLRSGSPPVSRQQSLPLLETAARQAQESYQQPLNSPADEERRRRRRDEEMAEWERKQREQELRDRENELEMRARELDMERARLQTLRETTQDPQSHVRDLFDREGNGSIAQNGQFGLRSRERRISLRHQLQRPKSQMDLTEVDERGYNDITPTDSQIRPRTQQPYPSAHLAPPQGGNNIHTPPATMQPLHSPKPSHPPSPLLQSSKELDYDSRTPTRYRDNSSNSNTNTTDTTSMTDSMVHAAYCGCESCSVNKYKEKPPQTRPQAQRSEKSKGGGWIRRLSMPVGNAFNLDSKKHQSNNSMSSTTSSNYGLGSGIAGGPATSSKGLFSLDSKKNVSTTALMSSGSGGTLSPQEDGRLRGGAVGRRSYEASGVSNRSMTNLGHSGRH